MRVVVLLVDLVFLVEWWFWSLMEVRVMCDECVDDDRACWRSDDLARLLAMVTALAERVIVVERSLDLLIETMDSHLSSAGGD